jgi:hypothetical protein
MPFAFTKAGLKATYRNDAATSLKDEVLDDFGVSHEKKM